jgi:hypothetical protein
MNTILLKEVFLLVKSTEIRIEDNNMESAKSGIIPTIQTGEKAHRYLQIAFAEEIPEDKTYRYAAWALDGPYCVIALFLPSD